jgi:hypothetical protein
VLESGEAVAQIRTHVRFRSRLIRELGVRVERRSKVVDRCLDPQPVDVGGAVSAAVVVTPGWETRRAPGGTAVEEEQLLLRY